MSKEIVLSGIQPSGKLHLGNYLGALHNFLALQNQHQCYFMIADYHSITENYDPAEKQKQIIELGKEFLAAGIDPKKCVIFIQSYIPEHTELAWIFNTVTPISYLNRMTQFKDKSEHQSQNINVGLFSYPVLQAADILLYHATAVPVGVDQDQHVELTRQIARFFNKKFGQTFAEPKSLHTKTPKVMSLLEPDKKMSKSLGDAHCIYISDEPQVIEKKLAKAVTDTGDGKGKGAENLFDLLKIFSSEKVYKEFTKQKQAKTVRYGDLKKQLANDLSAYFAEFRSRKTKITDSQVKRILLSGNKTAQTVSEKTINSIRSKIGLR